MFKGTIVNKISAVGDNIPINVIWNTNNNTSYDSNNDVINFNQSGYYNVNVMLNITGSTPTTIGAELLANGTVIPESLAESDITASTGTTTLNISDTIKVVPQVPSALANLSLQLTGVATISNGIVTIEKVR